MTKLILHAGTHKTGTTTFQTVLRDNRDWFDARGWHYAYFEYCPRSHNKFAHRLAVVEEQELPLLKREIEANRSAGRGLILSAEEFSVRTTGHHHWHGFDSAEYPDLRRAYLRRLHEVLEPFDEISVYLCFRRHDQYAESLYATNLISGCFNWSFDEFISRCHPIFDYAKTQRDFLQLFSRVHTIDFNSVKDALVQNYCQWMGLPVPAAHVRREKITPDGRLIYWLHRRSVVEDDVERQRLRGKFIKSQYAWELFASRERRRFSLWPSAEMRAAFVEQNTYPLNVLFSDDYIPTTYAVLDRSEMRYLDREFERWCSRIHSPGSRLGSWIRRVSDR